MTVIQVHTLRDVAFPSSVLVLTRLRGAGKYSYEAWRAVCDAQSPKSRPVGCGGGELRTHTHAGTPAGFGQTTQPFRLLFRFLGTLSSLRHEADVEAATPDRETDTKCDARVAACKIQTQRQRRQRQRRRGQGDSPDGWKRKKVWRAGSSVNKRPPAGCQDVAQTTQTK